MQSEPSAPAERAEHPDRPAWRDPVFLLCLAVVLAPFVVGLVRVLFVPWTSMGDWALIELRTSGVGGSHTPLVGAYSRFGWSHPGPALFFALALPYRLLGSQPRGLLFGTLLVNAASVATIVVLSWRRGRRPLTVGTAIALVVLFRALGADFLRDPWNPYITVLPFAALVFLSWSLVCGDRWSLPIAIGFGSFIVQSHVGYAALVLVVLGVAIGWWIVDLVRQRSPRTGPRTGTVVAVAVVVGLLAWLPPLIDQVVNPGNLNAIFDFFGKKHTTPTNDTAFRLVGRALALPGTWVTGHEIVQTSNFTPAVSGFFVPFGLVAIVAGVVVAVRRRDHDALALLVLVIAALGAAVYSISHVAGPLAAYLVRWLFVLGMLAWLAAGWALWPLLRKIRLGRAARVGVSVLVVAGLVVGTAVNVTAAGRDRAPWYRAGVAERNLARDTIAHVNSRGRPVVLMSKTDEWWTWGLAPRLEAAGIPVASRARDVLHFGRHRVALEKQARVALVVVVGPDALTTGRPAGGQLIASYVGHRDDERLLGSTANYPTVIHAAENGLLADTVGVYEVTL